ncbi:MAG: nitrate- and nitrite sensing domain-containing protein [Actinomycetota bacterium]
MEMLSFLRNARIRTRVSVAFMPAMLGLLLACGALLLGAWREERDMAALQRLTAVAPQISAVVHELQKERGNSAAFIGAKGEGVFVQRLADQRKSSDAAMATLDGTLAAFPFADYQASLSQRVEAARGALAQLPGKRDEVSRLGIDAGAAAQYYTGTIARLLDVVAELGMIGNNKSVAQGVTAYTALLQAKERTGIERAMGSNGFAAGTFAPAVFENFVRISGQQAAYLAVFRSQATAEQVAFYDQTVRGPAVDAVARMRAVAYKGPFSGSLEDIKAPDWFDAITQQIDLMKTVEDRLAADLVHQAEAIRGAALTRLLVLAAVVIALVAFTTTLALYVIRGIVNPLTAMSAGVGRLAAGESDVDIPCLDAGDEIGEIARSLSVIHETGVKAVRIQTALDTLDANVMMADTDGRIIYVNRAFLDTFTAHEAEIRGELPAFSTARLVGSSVDLFHKNPSARRAQIAALTTPHQARIRIGRLTFDLKVIPVVNASGERLGSVAQWTDMTAQLATEDEIARLVDAAAAGDFASRLPTEGKQGFMLRLSEGINQVVATVAAGLDDVVGVLGGMAEGDLTRRMSGNYQGAFRRLQQDSGRMADRVGQVLRDIGTTAHAVKDAAAEIAAGSADLSSRSEQQASALEETAASMEELAATVRSNSASAQQANQLAASARDTATQGGGVVGEAVDAMGRIEASSQKIGDIVGMIDEIAFQTNLLALNAAVEAARAGDAGKGFAVVAQEVRNLAQRSAQASREIKTLIHESTEEVRSGADLVKGTGESLDGIVTSVRRLADIVAEIASASGEQASGIEQVNEAVSHMDEMTQQNAAMVEESAAAAQALEQQAEHLAQLVAFFRVGAA